jgi:hypothetical protein
MKFSTRIPSLAIIGQELSKGEALGLQFGHLEKVTSENFHLVGHTDNPWPEVA